MDDRQKMRASDGDRQERVKRLRAALEDGRLKMDEYLDRMGLAYEAVTYGDLAALHADLPEAGSMAKREATPPATAPQAGAAPPGGVARLLAAPHADRPEAGSMARREAPPPATAPQAVAAPPGVVADLPAALKVLWTIWLAAVSINVVIWVLVSGTAGHLIYPWPVWVAGPSGAGLL